MSKMNTVFQTVQEMLLNDREINEIAELLGVSRSLIEHLDDYDDDHANYIFQSENFNDTNIFC